MEVAPEKNKKVGEMTFASIYPLYLNKIQKKGRTKDELNSIIKWLTGFDSKLIDQLINESVTFNSFFQKANINPKAHLIKGRICGYKIEEIDPKFHTYKNLRYLDKMVDELAKGKSLDKILRK